MIRASALNLTLAISLIIAVITGSLITIAYFYRSETLKTLRYKRHVLNIESGTAILLSPGFREYNEEQLIDLFEQQTDSIRIEKERWGIFDLNLVSSFTNQDTLKKAFLSGFNTETDHDVIYLSDEDRPISVSGVTEIIGDAMLPKSGVKRAYAEGKPFTGKNLINGAIKNSTRTLPALNSELISIINAILRTDSLERYPSAKTDNNSFLNKQLKYYAGSELNAIQLQGKIMLVSDTVITISHSAVLKDVIVFAPAVVIQEGFKGVCQIFARDSIVTGNNVVFQYPSSLGILKPEEGKIQSRIVLGENNKFSGILFSYEKNRSDLQTLISLGKNTIVEGEVYATGLIKLEKPVTILGKVSCNRFIIKTPTTLFENYLIDIKLNRSQRSKYYLSSELFSTTSGRKQVLKWIR